MNNSLSLIVLAILVVIIGGGGLWMLRHSQQRKQRIEQRLLAARRMAEAKALTDKAAREEKLRVAAAAINQAANERILAKRETAERQAAERAQQERAGIEREIAEWAAAEQAEAERAQQQQVREQRQETEVVQERLRAVEDAIADWVETERDGSRAAAPARHNKAAAPTFTRIEALREQVRILDAQVEKEGHDLEFIKNRIEADVDFLPIQFRQTIEDWKAGKILRRSTFDDIKSKFRYKAYSIEDGYEMLCLYGEWLGTQRQKLQDFIRRLGTEMEPLETIQAALERTEQAEREKYLEMDVDVIFAINEIRTILEKIIHMETVLKDLEAVCQKRSEQIIAPPWEARGSL